MFNIHNSNIIIVALIALFGLTGCNTIMKPKPYGLTAGLEDGAPSGTPGFRYGWKDGCTSGLAAMGSLMYKAAYDYTFDSTMLKDAEYKSAWELGFRHCRWYMERWNA